MHGYPPFQGLPELARAIAERYRLDHGVIEGDKDTDTRVVFNITEGPHAHVKSIEFVGNSFVSGGRLKTQIH